MDLKEHQGKKIFKKYEIPVPSGKVINQGDDLTVKIFEELGVDELVLKAQIPFGKRGKSGGILFVTREDFVEKAKSLLNKTIQGFKVEQLWVEEKLDIEKEYYLSTTLSRTDKSYMLVFSSAGGVDIEEISEQHPDKIIKIALKADWQKQFAQECLDQGLSQKVVTHLVKISEKLHQLSRNDVMLAEINPLILTKQNKLIAADSKVTLDANALFRHKEYQEKVKSGDGLEEEAKVKDLAYVQLDGDVGVIGNGAGLVMCALDTLAHFGGQPANFLDIGGGADADKMTEAMKIVLKNPSCKALFINIFGGITKCDEVAKGIVQAVKKLGIKVPMTVRLVGTNEKQGQAIMEQNNIEYYQDMEIAAKKAIKSAKESK